MSMRLKNNYVSKDRKYRRYKMKNENTEMAQDRIEIMEKIKKLEEEGLFDVDAENDLPTIELLPDKVDYLNKKSSSRLKARVANTVGERFLENLIKKNKLIIKEIIGLENFKQVKTGAMITCNHFNPFDCFTIESVFRLTEQAKNQKLYKVIREGNYTNFPGLYGFLFRNCDTLPLSSNIDTMKEFMNAVEKILQRGDYILIYPEQSLWWNYKKPKPLKDGAFKIAVKNNVPIIPIFITMEDSDQIGPDGFPIQEYTVHILEPIYLDKSLSNKENVEKMNEKNFQDWKQVYEQFYGIPLEYTTIKKETSEVNGN